MQTTEQRLAAQRLPAHEARLAAAQRVAQWELGDPSWADALVAAYCNPVPAVERVREAQDA